MVERVDPFEGDIFDGFEVAPRPAPVDQLGLVSGRYYAIGLRPWMPNEKGWIYVITP
jgi:hypothetical protein